MSQSALVQARITQTTKRTLTCWSEPLSRKPDDLRARQLSTVGLPRDYREPAGGVGRGEYQPLGVQRKSGESGGQKTTWLSVRKATIPPSTNHADRGVDQADVGYKTALYSCRTKSCVPGAKTRTSPDASGTAARSTGRLGEDGVVLDDRIQQIVRRNGARVPLPQAERRRRRLLREARSSASVKRIPRPSGEPVALACGGPGSASGRGGACRCNRLTAGLSFDGPLSPLEG